MKSIQDSLEPAAIRLTLEHLQEPARQSGYFLPAFFMYLYPQFTWLKIVEQNMQALDLQLSKWIFCHFVAEITELRI